MRQEANAPSAGPSNATEKQADENVELDFVEVDLSDLTSLEDSE